MTKDFFIHILLRPKIKKKVPGQAHWLKYVIILIWEAEIRRIVVLGHP
jgi:hypothetical protein